jgi:hypothetical protein
MIDLEDMEIAGKGWLSNNETVEPRANQNVLTSAARNRALERILGISRSKDHAAVRGVSPQNRIDDRLLGAQAPKPFSRPGVRAIHCTLAERCLFRGRHELISPGVIDQPWPIEACVDCAHERCRESRSARAAVVH